MEDDDERPNLDPESFGAAFDAYCVAKLVALNRLSPASLLDLMIDFFRDVKFAGIDQAADGDFLQFEYGGPWQWDDRGPHYEIGCRRILAAEQCAGDEDIVRVDVGLCYDLARFTLPDERAITSFDYTTLHQFIDTVRASPGFQIATLLRPDYVTYQCGNP